MDSNLNVNRNGKSGTKKDKYFNKTGDMRQIPEADEYMPLLAEERHNFIPEMNYFAETVEENSEDDEAHTIMSVLNTGQCEQMVSLIMELKEYCDSEGVKSVIHAAKTNVDVNIFDYSRDHEITGRYFINRLELMTSYVKNVAEKEYVAGTQIKEKYWIRSTGSDPHENGQHALFLVNKDNKKIERVYKPHDLTSDAAVVGRNGILSKIVEKDGEWLSGTPIKGETSFLTMDIDTESHTEEFLTKHSEMTGDEAEKYFFRAGMLKAVAETMSINDLHADNIMPIRNGKVVAPMIIDAEVNFLMNTDSGINLAMSGTEDNRNSIFKIYNIDNPDNTETSGDVFKDKDSKYAHKYTEGYSFMLTKMAENKEYFSDIYRNILTEVGDVRILPFDTATLKRMLEQVIEYQHEDVTEIDGYVDNICDVLRSELRKPRFIFSKNDNGLRLDIGKENLQLALRKNLEAGTIIAFYVSLETGEIFVGNILVAQITYEEKLAGREHIIEALAERFIETVQTKFTELQQTVSEQHQPESREGE